MFGDAYLVLPVSKDSVLETFWRIIALGTGKVRKKQQFYLSLPTNKKYNISRAI